MDRQAGILVDTQTGRQNRLSDRQGDRKTEKHTYIPADTDHIHTDRRMEG